MATREPHPLDGTYRYFDSHLEIEVGKPSDYSVHGVSSGGRFTFTGRYSLPLDGVRYFWPVIGGTLNEVAPGVYHVAFVLLATDVGDAALEAAGLGAFVDAWAGFALREPESGLVELLQLRVVNATFRKDAKAWSRFVWHPTFETYGARSYLRVRG